MRQAFSEVLFFVPCARNALAKEIGMHKLIYTKTWNNAPYSKGETKNIRSLLRKSVIAELSLQDFFQQRWCSQRELYQCLWSRALSGSWWRTTTSPEHAKYVSLNHKTKYNSYGVSLVHNRTIHTLHITTIIALLIWQIRYASFTLYYV